ncbi:MAG: hypothetical protein EXR50_02920 [Dehalococcoidia bacterium]|nr:hypothetical protein [Dehalococcoidia bacterium]
MIKRFLEEENGQALVIIVVMITAMVGFVALGIDGTNAFLQRAKVQHAADAVSRGGSSYLAGNFATSLSTGSLTSLDTTIKSKLDAVAAGNGYPAGPTDTFVMEYVDVTGNTLNPQALIGGGLIPNNTAGVRATPTVNFGTFLLGILNVETLSASATATSIFGSLGAASCGNLFPAVINGDTDGNNTYDANFALNSCYIIRDDGGSSPGGGSFGWADLNGGGGGASELRDWINAYASGGNTGCNTTITVATNTALLDTETGTKASLQTPTLNLINSTHNEVTVAIYDNYGTDNSCSNGGNSGSNLCYRIKGFGRFRITDVWIAGNKNPSPNPDTTACAQSTFDTDGDGNYENSDSHGILGLFVGYVDPNGQVSADATGPAKAVNIIE